MWGLEMHLRLAYGSELRAEHERLRSGPGPELASVAPHLPETGRHAIERALAKRNELDLLTHAQGVDLRAHAAFLLAVQALIPPTRGAKRSTITW